MTTGSFGWAARSRSSNSSPVKTGSSQSRMTTSGASAPASLDAGATVVHSGGLEALAAEDARDRATPGLFVVDQEQSTGHGTPTMLKLPDPWRSRYALHPIGGEARSRRLTRHDRLLVASPISAVGRRGRGGGDVAHLAGVVILARGLIFLAFVWAFRELFSFSTSRLPVVLVAHDGERRHARRLLHGALRRIDKQCRPIKVALVDRELDREPERLVSVAGEVATARRRHRSHRCRPHFAWPNVDHVSRTCVNSRSVEATRVVTNCRESSSRVVFESRRAAHRRREASSPRVAVKENAKGEIVIAIIVPTPTARIGQ